MSRFIDKLKRSSRLEPQPMGFRKAGGFEKTRLILVAEVKEIKKDLVEGADAIILEGVAKKPSTKIDLPVGARLSGDKAVKAEDFDFILFSPETPVNIARDERIGKVMVVEASLEMGLLGTIGELPLDTLFIVGDSPKVKAVTWQYLMLCRRFSAMSGKPVLAAVSPDASQDELQMLWDTGVSGVVADVNTAGAMKKLRLTADGLTPPEKHKRIRARAIVPSLGEAVPAIDEEEEEE